MSNIRAHVDFGGSARAGQQVSVFTHGTQTLANIYDRAGNALPNPVDVDQTGHVLFYAATGTYDVVGADMSRTVVLSIPAGPLHGELQSVTFTPTSETHTQQADVTGMTITFTVDDRPVSVEAWVPVATNSTAAQEVLVQITDNANVEKARGANSSATASKPQSVRAVERISTPGTYTRKMRIGNNQGSGGGTVTIFGTGSGPQFAPYLSATER